MKLLPLIQVIFILWSYKASAYPVYGTKRYGRSSVGGWGVPLSYQQLLGYPVNYNDLYQYNQNYPDDYYYPQDSLSYPVYYPPARTSKYEVYQAVLPYYYSESSMPRPRYAYYGYGGNKDPLVDLEEEVLEEERVEREESQPIGQETYYENDSTSSEDVEDVNAAFLQNLIMSEMYKNALDKHRKLYSDSDDSYGKWEEFPIEPKQDYYQEDDDVKELKQLTKARPQKPTAEERLRSFQGKNQNKKTSNKNKNMWNNWENKRALFQSNLGERKTLLKIESTPLPTTLEPSTTTTPKRDVRGQKEEVLMRPATPVRHPFSEFNLISDGQRKRTPSVYDTIKHLLDMERNLEKVGIIF